MRGGGDIILIEDNCEALGAEYQDKKCGTIGLMGSYSFFFSHHISTMEGGMITTDNKELYHILLSLRAHGWTRQLPKENTLTKKSDNPFYEQFRFILPGYNLRPLEMSGAIGIEQLKKLPKFIENRRKNAEYFINKFKNNDKYIIQKEIEKSSWFGFSIVLKSGNRDKIIKKLLENDIETRPIVSGNFVKNDVIKYFDYEIFGELKNSDYLHDNGFFVGNHHYDIRKEIDYLYEVLERK